jgi:hypothetical protein
VQVRWEGGGTKPIGEYKFFYGKENENHELGICLILCISAVKRVEFVCMSLRITEFEIPREIYGDNLNNVRRKASRYSRNKKRDYLKDKINELTINSKNIRDLYRGINKFKRGYQPRNNLVKEENGDLLTDFHNILFNVQNVSDVRQIEVQTAGPSCLEAEIAVTKLNKHKSTGSDQIQAGGETLL